MSLKVYLKCSVCGKDFSRYPSELERYKSVVCSSECNRVLRKKVNNIGYCLNCNKELILSPYYEKNGLKKFCSRECVSNYKLSHRIERKCTFCGNAIWLCGSSDRANAERIFCNRECFYEFKRKNNALSRKKPSRTCVCKTLKDHSVQLRDDPERLSTQFLQKLIGYDKPKKDSVIMGDI